MMVVLVGKSNLKKLVLFGKGIVAQAKEEYFL
jgi:hypothetical protein